MNTSCDDSREREALKVEIFEKAKKILTTFIIKRINNKYERRRGYTIFITSFLEYTTYIHTLSPSVNAFGIIRERRVIGTHIYETKCIYMNERRYVCMYVT
jgi:hypothetical protein